jgi:hypothetical protein
MIGADLGVRADQQESNRAADISKAGKTVAGNISFATRMVSALTNVIKLYFQCI